MANPDVCVPCKQKGLSILVSLVLPVPKDTGLQLPSWVSLPEVTKVELDGYTYALRAPRAGYIYVYLASHPKGGAPWMVWNVGQQGQVYPLPDPSLDFQIADQPCKRSGHSLTRLYTLVIERPLECGPAWIAFSEHQWSDDTLDRYAKDQALRAKRMQPFNPKELASSTNVNLPNIVAASKAVIDAIADYNAAFSFSKLPYDQEAGSKIRVSKPPTNNPLENGTHDSAAMSLHSTRYPWSLARKGQADQTLKMLLGCSKGGASDHPGVVIALPDPIGTVHELNGYCQDANGRLYQYGQEWEKEIHAMRQIDGLKSILEQHAVAMAKGASDAGVFKWSPDYTAKRMASVKAQFPNDPQRMAREQDLCRRWEQDAGQEVPSHVATQRSRYVSLPQAQWETHNAAIDKQAAQFTAKNTTTGQSIADQRRARTDAWSKAAAQDAAKEWPKYSAKVNQPALNAFRGKALAAEDAAKALLQKRVQDLIKWLNAPALITALEDFHQNNVSDGVAFEEVVSVAIEGINATPEGRKKLQEWADAAKQMPSNLVVRAMAFNQAEATKELHAVMQEMAHKQVVVTAESWAAAAAGIKFNKLADVYKKSVSLINANIKAAELGPSKMKRMPTGGADRLMVTIGDALFGKWISKSLDSTISEKVLQKLLLLRAGADLQMVDDLIAALASKEKVEREAIIERLRKGASVSTLKMDEAGKIRPAAADLEAKWKKLADAADTPDAKGKINAAKEARLAFIVALFEAYNLAKSANSVAGKTDDGKAWVVFAAASCSSSAAALDIYTNVAKGALEDSSLIFQRAKYLGAVLGAGGTLFSLATSAMESRSQWVRGNKQMSFLHASAAATTGFGGFFSFTAAIGYCGPLLEVFKQRYGGEVVRGGATRLAVLLAARGFMYRAVFTGLSIALSVVGLAIQFAIWKYSDKALAVWIEGCAFGINPEKGWTTAVQKEKLLEACQDQGVAT